MSSNCRNDSYAVHLASWQVMTSLIGVKNHMAHKSWVVDAESMISSERRKWIS